MATQVVRKNIAAATLRPDQPEPVFKYFFKPVRLEEEEEKQMTPRWRTLHFAIVSPPRRTPPPRTPSSLKAESCLPTRPACPHPRANT
jgi:hypothetical protein